MNDPQVIALIYAVEHGNSISYENARPLRYSESPEFDLTVEDKVARFELRELYADANKAREAIEPFRQHWEFDAALRGGPNSFSLRYQRAEIVDRNPSPPTRGSGTYSLRVEVPIPALETPTARITYLAPHYPPPPADSKVCLEDPDAKSMYDRYMNYWLGKEPLLSMAYFCLTVLEYRFIGQKPSRRENACRHYHIDREVLDAIGELTANKGDLSVARKRGVCVDPLTEQEERFLKQAVRAMVYRAAQVAADDSQRQPQITMAELPGL